MKILFIIGEENDSGITTYSKIIKEELIKKGLEVNSDEKYFEKYDIIHIHGRPNIKTIFSKLINKPRIVISAHVTSKEIDCFFPKQFNFVVNEFLKRGYSSTEKIFTYSKDLYLEFKKNPKTKNKVVFLPASLKIKRFFNRKNLDIKNFKKKFGLNGKKIVLCVGSIQERKGIFEFSEMAEKMPEYNFVWVGKIPKHYYLKNIKKIKEILEKKPKNLIFTGNLYEEDLVRAYYSSDLFWFPTKSETFGLVIVEAAASGKSVLIPKLNVFKQFKKFAIFYEKDASKKIKDILEKKQKYNTKILIGKKEVKKYDVEKNISKLIKEYEKTLKSKKPKITLFETFLEKSEDKKNYYKQILINNNTKNNFLKKIEKKKDILKKIKFINKR